MGSWSDLGIGAVHLGWKWTVEPFVAFLFLDEHVFADHHCDDPSEGEFVTASGYRTDARSARNVMDGYGYTLAAFEESYSRLREEFDLDYTIGEAASDALPDGDEADVQRIVDRYWSSYEGTSSLDELHQIVDFLRPLVNRLPLPPELDGDRRDGDRLVHATEYVTPPELDEVLWENVESVVFGKELLLPPGVQRWMRILDEPVESLPPNVVMLMYARLLLEAATDTTAVVLDVSQLEYEWEDIVALRATLQERLAAAVRSQQDFFGAVDEDVEVLVAVEGPNDVEFFRRMFRLLHQADATLPNCESDDRIAFLPLGGHTLHHWLQERYLEGLKRPTVHIFDREYASSLPPDSDQRRSFVTAKLEAENYLHSDAIHEALGVRVDVGDDTDVPRAVAALAEYGERKAKKKLNTQAADRMTLDRLRERGGYEEMLIWHRAIASFLR